MNTVCHIEIQSLDLDRSEAFFSGLFGWTFQGFTPEMRVFGLGETHIGGLMLADKVEPGRSPSVWIQVADVSSLLVRAVELGGTIVAEKSEVPTVGWSGEFADPFGNYFGVVQYKA